MRTFLLVILVVSCSSKVSIETDFQRRCKSFANRQGCTDKDRYLMGQKYNTERTAKGNEFRIVAQELGRTMGGVLKTTDFKADNIHELRLFKEGISCIKSKSGNFDYSLNDAVIVESFSGPLSAIEENQIGNVEYANTLANPPRAIALSYLAEVSKAHLQVVNTKGTYGIMENDVYRESRRVREVRELKMDHLELYDCPNQVCMGRHFNGNCYFNLSYTVDVLPKSKIRPGFAVQLDEAP